MCEYRPKTLNKIYIHERNAGCSPFTCSTEENSECAIIFMNVDIQNAHIFRGLDEHNVLQMYVYSVETFTLSKNGD